MAILITDRITESEVQAFAEANGRLTNAAAVRLIVQRYKKAHPDQFETVAATQESQEANQKPQPQNAAS